MGAGAGEKEGKRHLKNAVLAARGADFEGSLYDDERAGFDGAEGLDGGGRKGGGGGGGGGYAAKEGKKKEKQAVLAQLEAENDSARAQVERMRREFGL